MVEKEFVATSLDLDLKTFVVYMVSLSFVLLTNTDIYPFYKSQIGGLIAKKALKQSLPNMPTLQIYFF